MAHPMDEALDPAAVSPAHEEALAAVGDLVRGVHDDQRHDPTPCTEWDVERLIEHLVMLNRVYAAMADHAPLPPTDEHPDLRDLEAAFRATAEDSRRAFTRGGMLDERYPSPVGELSGAALVQHVTNELLAHGWDLAAATHQATDLAPAAATTALTVARLWYATIPRAQVGMRGEIDVLSSAPPADRLAGFFGREVGRWGETRWTRPGALAGIRWWARPRPPASRSACRAPSMRRSTRCGRS